MHHDMRALMATAGFTLQNEDEPGIYVRQATSFQEDPLNWNPDPSELLHEIQEHIERYRAESRSGT